MLAMIPSHSNFPFLCNSSFDLHIQSKRGGGRSRGDARTFFKERQGDSYCQTQSAELPLQHGRSVLRLWGCKGILFQSRSSLQLAHFEAIAAHKQNQQFCMAEHLNCNITSENIVMVVYHQHKLLLKCCISEHSLVG